MVNSSVQTRAEDGLASQSNQLAARSRCSSTKSLKQEKDELRSLLSSQTKLIMHLEKEV